MSSLLILILMLLAVPILGIAGFILAMGARERIAALELRLHLIDGRLNELATQVRGALAPQPPQAEAPRETPAPDVPAPEASSQAAPAAEAPPTSAGPPPEADAPPPEAPSEQPASAIPALAPAAATPSGANLADFERRFGTTWAAWIGGVALALGGTLLVRHWIEQGLLGPGLRIFLGALLAAVLVAAGEWTRRNERVSGIAGIAAANIPAILTAAGTVVAYATAYAAYALYDFLAPGPAFLLLGLVALVTLAAALLHGPALAGLGVVGAMGTPLLVATDEPNYWALYLYLAVVTAASFALARLRLWRWLALTAVVGGVLWTLPGVVQIATLLPHLFHVLAGFVLVTLLIVAGLFYGPNAEPGRIDEVSSAALGAYLLAAFVVVLASRHDPLALATFTLLVAACVAISWRSDATAAALPFAAALAALVIAAWAVKPYIDPLILPSGPTAPAIPSPPVASTGTHMVLGAFYAVLFGGAGFLAQGRSERPLVPILWSAAGVLAPIAILIALYYRLYAFERSLPFAAAALVLAALDGWAVEPLLNRPSRPGLAASTALFATGAIAALALALTLALEKGWLTIALALMVPGIAWVANARPLPLLRGIAAVIVAVVMARAAYDPRVVGGDLGTTPIFNWLLYGYGVPAVAFAYAGHLLRRRADDTATRATEAAAILFVVLLVVFEVRHALYGGDLFAPRCGLAEIGLYVSIALALTIGLERIRQRSGSIVYEAGTWLMGALACVGVVLGLGLVGNPMLSGEPVGGRFVNLVLLGYAVPAILVSVLALRVRYKVPVAVRWTLAIGLVLLCLAYLSLEVRTLFHGPVLTRGAETQAEQYTYSVVWLAFGVVLLAPGILLRSPPLRAASAAVMLVTIAKVFLYDMASLEGAYRAFSLIGLGLVLIAVGWIYQRILFPPRALASAPAGAAPS